jgi:hypothetical protein
MAAIDWDTVATAGATALLVTMAVEYLAKPLLEARKERILEALRARRDLLTLITKMTLAARKYIERLPDSAGSDLQKIWLAERNRHYDLMRQYALQVSDDFDRFAQAYNNRQVNEVLARYTFCVHGIVLSLRPRHRQAELIWRLGEPMAAVIEMPPLWRVKAWARSQDKVRQLVAEIEDASAPELPAS